MVATLWAQQIISDRKKYSQVPPLLKDRVKKILIDGGYENLVEGGD